jgi:hypothetical protein
MYEIKLEWDNTAFGAYSEWKFLKFSMEQAIKFLKQENVFKR